MAATKIDGVAIAKKIREALKSKIEAIQATDSTFKPSLTIVQGLSCF
jgi:methylenetetrahydrofolate dehydrogenase (NADP+)/methenyltetrahydrofolate cyclohydrolase/formyltetrahydrofolate synthetase